MGLIEIYWHALFMSDCWVNKVTVMTRLSYKVVIKFDGSLDCVDRRRVQESEIKVTLGTALCWLPDF